MSVDPLPLSIVEHYAYCPRQAALIHVEGIWTANADTALGEAHHEAVDRGVRSETRDGVVTWMSLPVWSEQLGIAGICDAVELDAGRGGPMPIEYKPRMPRGRFGPASQQVAAQAMCLEEMWHTPVNVGVLFTHTDRRRHQVSIDAVLRDATARTIDECHGLLRARKLPPVLADRRCDRCSVAEACGVHLPDLPVAITFADQPEGDW